MLRAQVVLQDAPHGADAVAPADLLAFAVGTAGVRDADLVDATAEPRDLGGDLGLEPEAVFLDLTGSFPDRRAIVVWGTGF